jgi:hypothetical protein
MQLEYRKDLVLILDDPEEVIVPSWIFEEDPMPVLIKSTLLKE